MTTQARGSDLVDYNYVGAYDMAAEEKHPGVAGGLTLTFGFAGNKMLGWDRFGRTIHQQWRNEGTTAELDRFDYTYDRAGNRLTTDRNVGSTTADDGYSESFGYDNLDRLIDYRRGTQDGTGYVPKTPTSTSLVFRQTWARSTPVVMLRRRLRRSWQLEQVRPRRRRWGCYGCSNAEPHRKRRNELQTVTGNSPAWTTPGYDAAGNMTTTPKGGGNENTSVYFVYDGWNRVAGISATATPDGDFIDAGEVQYKYDGMGRRIAKLFATGSTQANEDTYYNENYQVMENRRNGSSNAYEQLVWDQRYIDAPVLRYRDANGRL